MLNWQSIDTVLLDMDGTLLDLHFDNLFWLHRLPEQYAKQNGLTVEQAKDLLYPRFEKEKGSIQWYCLDYWTEQLDVDINALKLTVKDKIAIRPFVLEFLSQLQQAGKQVILLTNAHRDSLELKLAQTKLHEYFTAMVSSHDFGYPKEQQALWQAFEAKYPFDKTRTLFVDDTEAVLASAKQFGIAHLLTLKQPDSQKPLRDGLNFPAILHFDEVMPVV